MPRSGRPLSHYVYLSWCIAGTFAVLAIATAFIAFGWLNYHHAITGIEGKLREQAAPISRRLAAELLLDKSGAPDPVAKALKDEYQLASVEILSKPPICMGSSSFQICTEHEGGYLYVYNEIPHVPGTKFLQLATPAPSALQLLDFSLLGWSILPVLLALVLGLFLQRHFLRRYVLRPIESLADNAVLEEGPEKHWPQEIREISSRLAESFQKRDQVVFGQLARGVIHDIKTHLHSILSAAELVGEADANSATRAKRLELLHKACRINIPKMKAIIEHTLDGSREITVRKEPASLKAAIENAVLVNGDLAASRDVTVRMDLSSQDLMAAHDLVQIERVFTNVVKNAIEAFDGDDEELLDYRQVRISGRADGRYAHIVIEDSGRGVTISDPLFRPLRSTKPHGSGLGLFISKKIVEAHDGTIGVTRSETLGGAAFYVRLPRMEGQINA